MYRITLLTLIALATAQNGFGRIIPAKATATTKDPVVCRIEFDRAVLIADTPQKAVMKVALQTPEIPSEKERPPVNLSIVLDRSGSMGGDKIVKAREAAIEALHRLGPNDIFSLIAFDDQIETVVPAQPAVNTEWIESRIRAIQPRGSTALFAGVSQGATEIRKNIEDRGYVSRIILLSDGQANVGPSSPHELGRLGAALMKEGVSVSTVGVGTDYNEDLMTRLSQQSDGNSYFVASSSDLPRIFKAELGSVLTVVARKVIIEIVCDDGVKPVRIIGREGRIQNNRVELALNQLYGGQEKFALVEVEIPASRVDEERSIALASCRYVDAISTREQTASARGTMRFSRDKDIVTQSVNRDVAREVGLNEAAIVVDRAIELNDAGKREEAEQLLKTESRRVHKVAKEYDIVELEEQAKDIATKADLMGSRQLDSEERKSMRTKSFQLRNQQMQK